MSRNPGAAKGVSPHRRFCRARPNLLLRARSPYVNTYSLDFERPLQPPEPNMFDSITRFFTQPADERMADNDPRLAVAVLLVHLAAVDGSVGDEEKRAVRAALQQHFGLEEDVVRELVHEARRRDAEAVDLYHFTSTLAQLPEEERIEIVRMMWQVVFADSQNHELEDNLVWRVAELIGVSARQRTVLRNQMARR